MIRELEQMGGTHATLEASSHALDLGRIYAMNFHTAGFTNFTRDHLDYHHTMEAYFTAKQLLFKPRGGPPPRFAVLNADDEAGRRIEVSAETKVFWYGIDQAPPARANAGLNDTWVRAADIQSSFEGLRFTILAGEKRFSGRLYAGWAHQRVQHPARLRGGVDARLARRTDSERTKTVAKCAGTF